VIRLPRALSRRDDVAFDDVVPLAACGSRPTSSGEVPTLVRNPAGRPGLTNFAVVVDDALMAITHVIRGARTTFQNTPRQYSDLPRRFGWTPACLRARRDGPRARDHTKLSKASRRDVGGRVPRARLHAGRRLAPLPSLLIGGLAGEDQELLPLDAPSRGGFRSRGGWGKQRAWECDVEKLAWVKPPP
jgi:hypothetical protein